MIFTDRKITIRNGKSSINEPVILYRGDYEVSIKFTIMESKFRFKSGVNLVDSEKASYGQLAILAPYGGNVFSEVVKCEDGTVTFTLTKEMIDQLEEVGLYSFQIRLFDYYRESRVSIPPVEFGIEVREPVASEDHDNTVNEAIVGYSIAKVVDPSKENVGDTFDADGNYNKTNWETGDRISEGQLNKIEDALDTINANELNDKKMLNKQMISNYNVLSDAIDTKVDALYVDTKVNAVASGSPKGVYATVAALTSAIPKGNSNIYVVSADGCWYYWNGNAWTKGGTYQSTGIGDNTIQQRHLEGVSGLHNLYNPNTQLTDGYIHYQTAQIVNDPAYKYAKIPIIGGMSYFITKDVITGSALAKGEFIVFIDAVDDVLCSYECVNLENGMIDNHRYVIVTAPDNAAYIGINAVISSYKLNYEDGIILFGGDELPDGLCNDINSISELFGKRLADLDMRQRHNSLIRSIETTNMKLSSDVIEKIPNTVVDSSGVILQYGGWTAGRIAVKSNTRYSLYLGHQIYDTTSSGGIVFEDVNKKHIGGSDLTIYKVCYLKSGLRYIELFTPANCHYLVVNLKTPSNKDNAFNIENDICLIEGKMHDSHINGIVTSINGACVLSSDTIELYQSFDAYGYYGDVDSNLLSIARSMELVRYNKLYDSVGTLQSASGWTAIDIPVTGGETYYFFSESQVYSPHRGLICLLDAKRNIIGTISGQDTNMYADENEMLWQIIETTASTCYVGITVQASNNKFDDLYSGVFVNEQPANRNVAYAGISTINNYSIVADKMTNNAFTTTWDDNDIFKGNFIRLEGYLYNDTGALQMVNGWTAINVPVIGGETYYYHANNENYNSRGSMCLLDANQHIIEPITGLNTNVYYTENGSKWQVIETTNDTCYVGITVISNFVSSTTQYNDLDNAVLINREPVDADIINSIVAINNIPIGGTVVTTGGGIQPIYNPLFGKKWTVIGDSLTESNIRATKNYHDYVAEETGVIVVNQGLSGTGYMKDWSNFVSYYKRVSDIPLDTDIITIFGSTNDVSQITNGTLTLGTPADNTVDTICGCMHETFKRIFERLPGVRIGVVLPCPTGHYPPHVVGNDMELYSKALAEIAGYYSIPVLDLYHGSNLRPWDDTFRSLYYTRDDGNSVHPDENGQKLLANKFKMFIQSL